MPRSIPVDATVDPRFGWRRSLSLWLIGGGMTLNITLLLGYTFLGGFYTFVADVGPSHIAYQMFVLVILTELAFCYATFRWGFHAWWLIASLAVIVLASAMMFLSEAVAPDAGVAAACGMVALVAPRRSSVAFTIFVVLFAGAIGLWLAYGSTSPTWDPSEPAFWYQTGAFFLCWWGAGLFAYDYALSRMAAASEATRQASKAVQDALGARLKDVSRRLEAERQLRRNERNQELARRARVFAHDSNNQLQVIIGVIELLGRKPRQSDDHRRWLGRLMQAVDQNQALLCVLQERGADADTTTSGIRAVDQWLPEQIEALATQLPKGVELQLEIEPAPAVSLSGAELHQVLLNLIINARDAIHGEGTIVVRLRAQTDSGASTTTGVLIEVCDTGVGMDADTQGKAMEMGFTTKGAGGSGVGLSSVRSIVEEVGGRIDLTSSPGKGTIASIWLPPANESA